MFPRKCFNPQTQDKFKRRDKMVLRMKHETGWGKCLFPANLPLVTRKTFGHFRLLFLWWGCYGKTWRVTCTALFKYWLLMISFDLRKWEHPEEVRKFSASHLSVSVPGVLQPWLLLVEQHFRTHVVIWASSSSVGIWVCREPAPGRKAAVDWSSTDPLHGPCPVWLWAQRRLSSLWQWRKQTWRMGKTCWLCADSS